MDLLEILRRVATRAEILDLATKQDEVEEATVVLEEKKLALRRFAKELERRHREQILELLPAVTDLERVAPPGPPHRITKAG